MDNSISKVPYEYITFTDFVGLVGRLFYDDACIVILDFLAKERKAFLESDLREKLGWRESLVQQKLYLLKQHMLVTSDTLISKGSRNLVHWRIHHRINLAIQYRYEVVIQYLAKLVDGATQQHEFECSSSNCDGKFTALEVASSFTRLEDHYPLCSLCGSVLKLSALEEILNQAKQKRAKVLEQLEPLRRSLITMKNMDIPIFPNYSKKQLPKDSPISHKLSNLLSETSNESRETEMFPTSSNTLNSLDNMKSEATSSICSSLRIPWFRTFESDTLLNSTEYDFPKECSANLYTDSLSSSDPKKYSLPSISFKNNIFGLKNEFNHKENQP